MTDRSVTNALIVRRFTSNNHTRRRDEPLEIDVTLQGFFLAGFPDDVPEDKLAKLCSAYNDKLRTERLGKTGRLLVEYNVRVSSFEQINPETQRFHDRFEQILEVGAMTVAL